MRLCSKSLKAHKTWVFMLAISIEGKQISDFVYAEEDLRAKAEAKKKSPINRVLGKEASDFEEFMALEKIKQQKDQLQSMMRLYGRPGM